MYTGAWEGGESATLGGKELTALRPRELHDDVGFVALLSRGGMWIAWLKVSGGFCRSDPYNQHDLSTG